MSDTSRGGDGCRERRSSSGSDKEATVGYESQKNSRILGDLHKTSQHPNRDEGVRDYLKAVTSNEAKKRNPNANLKAYKIGFRSKKKLHQETR